MKIGVLTALGSEFAQIAEMLEEKSEFEIAPFRYVEGKLGGNTLVLMQCGIGKVNAAAGTVELILNFRPDCIISTGVAGGIDAKASVMSVVVSKEIVYHDVWCGEGNAYGQVQGLPVRFSGNPQLRNIATTMHSDVPVSEGLICCGDRFVTSQTELQEIKEKFPDGLAVDMESGAIAQVCHMYDVPFASFRIISDTPGADEHWKQYENFWDTLAANSFGVTKRFLEALPDAL